MDIPTATPRQVRVATGVALAGFVGYLFVPSGVRLIALVVMIGGSLALVACAAGWIVGGPARARHLAWLAVVSAAGLVGSVLYLISLADDPTAIPVVGVPVLLLSLVGLSIVLVKLRQSAAHRFAG